MQGWEEEEGLAKVLNSQKRKEYKGCWKEICK